MSKWREAGPDLHKVAPSPSSPSFRNLIVEELCRESRQWDVSNVSLVSIAKGFLLGFGDDNPFFGNENSKSRMKVRVGHQCFFYYSNIIFINPNKYSKAQLIVYIKGKICRIDPVRPSTASPIHLGIQDSL